MRMHYASINCNARLPQHVRTGSALSAEKVLTTDEVMPDPASMKREAAHGAARANFKASEACARGGGAKFLIPRNAIYLREGVLQGHCAKKNVPVEHRKRGNILIIACLNITWHFSFSCLLYGL